MTLTRGEMDHLSVLALKLQELRLYLGTNILTPESLDSRIWYQHLVGIKRIVGNLNNDVSFVASLMAKEFLQLHHNLDVLDCSSKSQSAPGLDIDIRTLEEERIIGEIKTTISYKKDDLGSQQKTTFFKDFDKLASKQADFKYFFLTERETFEIVKKRYLQRLKGVSIILVPQATEDENAIFEIPSHETTTVGNDTGSPMLAGPGISKKRGELANTIRSFILANFIVPARNLGKEEVQINSGDIHRRMELNNRYPAVCSAMEGQRIEKVCNITIVKREGKYGAHFRVSYVLCAAKPTAR